MPAPEAVISFVVVISQVKAIRKAISRLEKLASCMRSSFRQMREILAESKELPSMTCVKDMLYEHKGGTA